MAKANFSAEAEQDLKRIAAYIARNNLTAALSWLQETRAVCNLIATQPEIGQHVLTVRHGLVRGHVVGNYLVYFVSDPSGINVVRVVHAGRDQNRVV